MYLFYQDKSSLYIPTNAVRMNRKQSWQSKNKGVRTVDRSTASNNTLSCIINTFTPAESLVLSPGNHNNFNTLLSNQTENACLYTHIHFFATNMQSFYASFIPAPTAFTAKINGKEMQKTTSLSAASFHFRNTFKGKQVQQYRSLKCSRFLKDFIGVLSPHLPNEFK